MKKINKILITSGAASLLLVGFTFGVVREGVEIEEEIQVEVESRGEVEIEEKSDQVNPRMQETAPGQDYNSSRSDKPRTENVDADSDGDGIEDGEEDSVELEASGNGEMNSWGKGLNVSIENREENQGSETALRNLKQVQVKAEDVRGWSEAEKEQLRQQIREEDDENNPERRVARITEMVMNNNRLGDIESNEEKTEIKYQARMKLFGFIPVEREIQATMNNEGKVEMNYPWYSFFSTRPDDDEITNTLSELLRLRRGSTEEQ